MRREDLAEGVTLYCGDMRDILPALGMFDACVTDPPYGLGEAAGKARGRTAGRTGKVRKTVEYRRDYGFESWDDVPCSREQIELMRNASKWQIIFGGNYFEGLGPTSCWLVWDKLNGETDFADCELAWTNLEKAVRRVRILWNGCMRVERSVAREHPTQKPIAVMQWCIGHLPQEARTIVDPFMGVGTTGLAAIRSGRCFTGIEQEPKYFDIACRRIADELSRPRLDLTPAPKPVQEGLPL